MPDRTETESTSGLAEAAGGLARHLFISYASHDAQVAQKACSALEAAGFPCWMAPRDVKPGAQYADAIVRAINEARAVVLVLSGSAVASSHVGREVERAASKHKQIIAFRVDAAALNPALEYFLSESQWIDVQVLGMSAALTKLAEAVRQGPAPASAADHIPAKTDGKMRRLAIAATVIFGVGAVVALGIYFWSMKPRGVQGPVVAVSGTRAKASAEISDKSIAVLPFVDMSEKKDQEYFADGMAEAILDLLTKIPGLTVIGRTSSFQFKGKNADLRTIGTQLNAAYLLEGSVRRSGDQVRITAQLITTRTGAHEWSQTYDRRIAEVLKLQDAIAAAVVRELQLTVAPEFLFARSTVKNADAYDLMLRGRHAVDRYDQDGLDEAVTLFQQALGRDPTSADAAAGLAYAYETQGEFEFLAPSSAFELARRAAATALKLDPKSAEAHSVLGQIHVNYDWDWPAAEREFQQAATLAPGSAEVLNGEAKLSLALGRWDDALRHIKAALAQDPLDAGNLNILSDIEVRRGHLLEAEAARRRAQDIRPNPAWGHYYLGRIMLARGDHDAALTEIQQETVEAGKQPGLAMIYHALGRKADSDAALARMLKSQADGNAFGIAEVYAFRGQSDEAMHWLERAYAQKDPGLYYVKGDLPLKSLEADPRFKALLRNMHLPE